MIVEYIEGITYSNFATNGVLVENNNIILTLYNFLDGKINYCAAVNNKHNIKNNSY